MTNRQIGKLRLASSAVAVASILALTAPASRASLIGQLTVANANLATQGPGPYAGYDITGTTGTGGTFTGWHVAVTGQNNFVFGGTGGFFALNLSTGVTGAGAGTLVAGSGSITPLTQTSSGNMDGFGSFNFRLDDSPGFSNPHSSFTFDFTTANPVSEANLLDSTLPNVAGHMALATNTACSGFAANGGGGSGSVDDTTHCVSVGTHDGDPVPEPASLTLLGVGVLGLGFVTAKRRK